MIVSALYAGLLGLMLIALSVTVIRHRLRAQVGIGVGQDAALQRAVRVHANFIEYTPVFLVLLLLAEVVSQQSILIHALGAAFLIGRVLHAIGLSHSSGTSAPRFAGMILTFLCIALTSLLLVVTSILQLLA
jgi:uncharacterized membrane protein YecN with MAPEG domain